MKKIFFVLEKIPAVEECQKHRESMLTVSEERFNLTKMQVTLAQFKQRLGELAKIVLEQLLLDHNLELKVEAFGYCQTCGAFFVRCIRIIIPDKNAYWEETTDQPIDTNQYFVFIDPNKFGFKIFVCQELAKRAKELLFSA